MTLYQWLTILGLPTIFGMLWRVIANQLSEKKEAAREREIIEERQKATNRVILRNMMRRDGQAYKRRNYASMDEKDDFEECYIQYHNNDGNGVMGKLREEVLSLPTEPMKGV